MGEVAFVLFGLFVSASLLVDLLVGIFRLAYNQKARSAVA